MIAKQLLQAIKAHKGPLLVEICNFDDVFWIQAVKSDLLAQLDCFKATDETGFILDSRGHLSKDY